MSEKRNYDKDIPSEDIALAIGREIKAGTECSVNIDLVERVDSITGNREWYEMYFTTSNRVFPPSYLGILAERDYTIEYMGEEEDLSFDMTVDFRFDHVWKVKVPNVVIDAYQNYLKQNEVPRPPRDIPEGDYIPHPLIHTGEF